MPTGPPDLTETTVRYVFAAEWLPSSDSEQLVAVPGGATKALDTAGSLLHVALWALRRDRVIDFEQIRPVEDEPVRVFGGRSFCRFTPLDRTARRAGLEGALIQAAATLDSPEDLRVLLRALDLDNRGPWKTVCNHCYAEASAAGLVGTKGRLFKKVVVADVAAVDALRPRHEELRAERRAYMDAEEKLSLAVASDCLRVIADGFSPGGGDNL